MSRFKLPEEFSPRQAACGCVDQLTFLLTKIREFADQRRRAAKPHEIYRASADPVPVSITKVHTSPWGTQEPITIPEECRVEIYWQAMPGEKLEDIDREFFEWLNSLAFSRWTVFAASKGLLSYPVDAWIRDFEVGAHRYRTVRLCDTRARERASDRRHRGPVRHVYLSSGRRHACSSMGRPRRQYPCCGRVR